MSVTDAALYAACKAHTPQFDRMDSEIQQYAREQMRLALEAAEAEGFRGLLVAQAALQKIADLRYSEASDPLDDACDIADKALSSTRECKSEPNVPHDPTDAMINAGLWADRECDGDERAGVINTWHAMYGAAIVSTPTTSGARDDV